MADMTAPPVTPPTAPATPWYQNLWGQAQQNNLPQAALIGLLSMIPPLFASGRRGRERLSQGWGNLGANLAIQTALKPMQQREALRNYQLQHGDITLTPPLPGATPAGQIGGQNYWNQLDIAHRYPELFAGTEPVPAVPPSPLLGGEQSAGATALPPLSLDGSAPLAGQMTPVSPPAPTSAGLTMAYPGQAATTRPAPLSMTERLFGGLPATDANVMAYATNRAALEAQQREAARYAQSYGLIAQALPGSGGRLGLTIGPKGYLAPTIHPDVAPTRYSALQEALNKGQITQEQYNQAVLSGGRASGKVTPGDMKVQAMHDANAGINWPNNTLRDRLAYGAAPISDQVLLGEFQKGMAELAHDLKDVWGLVHSKPLDQITNADVAKTGSVLLLPEIAEKLNGYNWYVERIKALTGTAMPPVEGGSAPPPLAVSPNTPAEVTSTRNKMNATLGVGQ